MSPKSFTSVAVRDEALGVRDQLVHLDRVDELAAADLPVPGRDRRERRPRIERRVELDRAEAARVMLEPAAARQLVRIEALAPVPVVPARAADVSLDGRTFGARLAARACGTRVRLLVIEPRDVHLLRTHDVLRALLLAACLAPCAALGAFFVGQGGHSRFRLRGTTRGRNMAEHITLTVNGVEHTVHAEPDTPLLYVLRNDLKLKGAKFGCGLGQCGSCMVLIDGRNVTSCDTPLWAVAGKVGHDDRSAGHAGRAQRAAARVHRRAGGAMRLLHQRHGHDARPRCSSAIPIRAKPRSRRRSSATSAAAARRCASSGRSSAPRAEAAR